MYIGKYDKYTGITQIVGAEGIENVQNSYVVGEPIHKQSSVINAKEMAQKAAELKCS